MQNLPTHMQDSAEPTPSPHALRRRLRRAGFIAGALFGVVLIVGTGARFAQSNEVKNWTLQSQIPTVSLIAPTPLSRPPTLLLPGTLRAFYDAQLYSRVPGYVKGWYRDIGAHVRKGELLADIDTPELDQQMAQARANLEMSMSARTLSQITAQRWDALLPLDAVSKQAAQERTQDVSAKSSAVKAAQADLDRLKALKHFSRIVAPFDGIVTARNADYGTLVSGGQAGAEPLFAVADVHRLRLYVHVPQAYSSQIGAGIRCSLAVPEYPGRQFEATLSSTSDAISAQSGTLLVELAVDNRAGELKPGDYAKVTLNLAHAERALTIPASALIFRSSGLQVATLHAGGRIAMKPVLVGRDLGARVEISSGLDANDRIVDSPPDSLADGDTVRIAGGAASHGA
ncbi:MAG: efflux RND transporter periplasmic adaptor subunit [Proteobacteria bacterium]|nr:efflux RND transporter periplasmic adaptor subunit [Pseudomonadota bacterium]